MIEPTPRTREDYLETKYIQEEVREIAAREEHDFRDKVFIACWS